MALITLKQHYLLFFFSSFVTVGVPKSLIDFGICIKEAHQWPVFIAAVFNDKRPTKCLQKIRFF